jgi:hypothetical protein
MLTSEEVEEFEKTLSFEETNSVEFAWALTYLAKILVDAGGNTERASKYLIKATTIAEAKSNESSFKPWHKRLNLEQLLHLCKSARFNQKRMTY